VKLFLPPTLALLVRTVKPPSLYFEVPFDHKEDAFVLPWYRTLEQQEGRTINSSQHARECTLGQVRVLSNNNPSRWGSSNVCVHTFSSEGPLNRQRLARLL
jgi:hypothetical protein